MSINLIEYIFETCKAEVYLPNNYIKCHTCRTWLESVQYQYHHFYRTFSRSRRFHLIYISYCMKESKASYCKRESWDLMCGQTLFTSSRTLIIFYTRFDCFIFIIVKRGRAYLLLNQSKNSDLQRREM